MIPVIQNRQYFLKYGCHNLFMLMRLSERERTMILTGVPKGTSSKTFRHFEVRENVKDQQKLGRALTAPNDNVAVGVSQSFVGQPHTSICKVSQAHDIESSICGILNRAKFYP